MTWPADLEKRVHDAQSSDPRTHPWGVFDRDVTCPDTATFLWFESPEALRSFLLEVEPLIHDVAEEELAEEQIKLRDHLPPFSELAPARAADLEKFNEVAGSWEVGWIGHFSDLVRARSDFAKMLVATFRKSEAYTLEEVSPEDLRPIPRDEVEAFAAFLHGEEMLDYWDVA